MLEKNFAPWILWSRYFRRRMAENSIINSHGVVSSGLKAHCFFIKISTHRYLILFLLFSIVPDQYSQSFHYVTISCHEFVFFFKEEGQIFAGSVQAIYDYTNTVAIVFQLKEFIWTWILTSISHIVHDHTVSVKSKIFLFN